VAFAVQVLVTYAIVELPQALVAVMVKICVTAQTFVVGTPPLTVTVAELQVSFVEDTADCTLARVGTLVGLQPKLLPAGTPISTRGDVSTVQVLVTCAVAELPQAFVAKMVKICVTAQALVVQAAVTEMPAELQVSFAFTAD